MEWEKIFSNYMSDKRLISKLHKQLTQLSKTTNNPIKAWAKKLRYVFPKKIYKWPSGT